MKKIFFLCLALVTHAAFSNNLEENFAIINIKNIKKTLKSISDSDSPPSIIFRQFSQKILKINNQNIKKILKPTPNSDPPPPITFGQFFQKNIRN